MRLYAYACIAVLHDDLMALYACTLRLASALCRPLWLGNTAGVVHLRMHSSVA
jgi:hypothetical protein